MRRAVALLVSGLLLAGCTATVDGRAATDSAAVTAPGATTDPAASTGPGTQDTASTSATPRAPEPTESAETAETAATAVTSAEPATSLPPGFYVADTDLGYRPMATEEFDCAPGQGSGCFGIMVFSVNGCPAGAIVTVGIFDKAVDPINPLGSATGLTPAIAPGGTQPVVIADSTGATGQLTARIRSVTC